MAEKEEIGDFSLLAEGGTIALHISFSLAREKEMWSGFRCESRSFFFLLHVLKQDSLVPCGLVSPLAPLTLTGAGRGRFLLFGIESISF